MRDRHIDGGLADGIGTRHVELDEVDEVRGGEAGGEGEDFFGGAVAEEGHEGVDGLDDADDVGFEAAGEVFG